MAIQPPPSSQELGTLEDEQYLYAAVRYVERNPVRSGLVKYAWDYYWSSARAHVFELHDPILLGSEKQIMNIAKWDDFLKNPEDDKSLNTLRKNFRTVRPIGNNSFIDMIESKTGRRLRFSGDT